MPWSRKLYEERRAALLEPHSRCKASGGVREIQTPYGIEIVELPELQRVYLFDIGGPHTQRANLSETLKFRRLPRPQGEKHEWCAIRAVCSAGVCLSAKNRNDRRGIGVAGVDLPRRASF